MSYTKSKKPMKLADALKSPPPKGHTMRAAQKSAKAGGKMGFMAKKC